MSGLYLGGREYAVEVWLDLAAFKQRKDVATRMPRLPLLFLR